MRGLPKGMKKEIILTSGIFRRLWKRSNQLLTKVWQKWQVVLAIFTYNVKMCISNSLARKPLKLFAVTTISPNCDRNGLKQREHPFSTTGVDRERKKKTNNFLLSKGLSRIEGWKRHHENFEISAEINLLLHAEVTTR